MSEREYFEQFSGEKPSLHYFLRIQYIGGWGGVAAFDDENEMMYVFIEEGKNPSVEHVSIIEVE